MTASEITPNLYLGDANDAVNFDGIRLCVLETPMVYPIPRLGDTHIPIFEPARGKANPKMLDAASDWIDAHLGVRALVHCGAGVERSPLTVAWWLVKTHRVHTFEEAYAQLKTLRPQVEDRTAWLPA